MEEQRIGVMYLNMVKGWFTHMWDALFPNGLMRSKLFPALIVAAILIIPSAGYYLHRYAIFHEVKKQINGDQVAAPSGPQPGGLEPIVLTRGSGIAVAPEFRSATLLPGLGMGVLQIMAYLPGRGEVPLLSAPSLQEIADNSYSRSGVNDNHGALELPWSGSLAGLISPLGTAMTVTWQGHTLSVARDAGERAGIGEGGMLAMQGVDNSNVSKQASAATATAEFKSTDFGGHWLSKTNISVTTQLSATALDLTITAKNTGDEPEPMGIGWHPRFAIVSGDRDSLQLKLPNGERLEPGDRARSLPTGKFGALNDVLNRFQGHPMNIGPGIVDEAEVNLKTGAGDMGPSAEYRDLASGYGLRMTALSTSVRQLRVSAPSGSSYVSLGMQTNLDDPFGKEWNGAVEAPITTLLPGQSIDWKVRLEIFPVKR